MAANSQLDLQFPPKPRVPYVFKHQLAIVCEGLADREFLRRLIKVRAVPDFDVPFPHDPNVDVVEKENQILGGKSRIPHMLRAVKFSESTKAVLLVLDSCDDVQATFNEACQYIREAGDYGVPTKLAEIAPGSSRVPSVAVATIPPGEIGALESLCYRALVREHPEIDECIEQLCECSDVKNWNAEPQAKARLQCGIAVLNKDDPNKTLRWIFERELELIPIRDPAFDPVERLLCDFAGLVIVSS